MYYSIDCIYGNGKGKNYPSDSISFFGDTVKEIMDKFIFANKHFNFKNWQHCYMIKWFYEMGDYEPSDPITIKFKKNSIEIKDVGIFDAFVKIGGVNATQENKN